MEMGVEIGMRERVSDRAENRWISFPCGQSPPQPRAPTPHTHSTLSAIHKAPEQAGRQTGGLAHLQSKVKQIKELLKLLLAHCLLDSFYIR